MINPRGGLIGTGHPLGATGISQTIEIVQQLQKTAENRQTNNPKTSSSNSIPFLILLAI